MIIRVCIAALALVTAVACVHAGAEEDSLRARADKAYAEQAWMRAHSLYREVLEGNPADGRAWYRLAVAARQSGRPGQALEALEMAGANGVPAQFTQMERARVFAGQGRVDDALAALQSAVDAGFANPQVLASDADLSALHQSEGFDALVAKAQANKAPCAARPAFREFDFWLGEWEVRDARDNVAGRNTITSVEGGCYLLEQWRGAGGSTGSSMNYYDAARGKWVQHWISQGGTQIQIEGGLVDGSMVLDGKIYYLASGQKADFRGTWTPLEDGRVRQYFEQSVDGGKTWSPWFEGFYTRVTREPDGHSHAGG